MRTSTVVELVVVYGLAVVVPLALAAPFRPWLAAAAAAYVSFLLPTGPVAAALVLPVGVLAALEVVERARPLLPPGWPSRRSPGRPVPGDVDDGSRVPWRPPTLWAAVDALPAVWAVVAAQSLVTSRGGWVVLGQHEPFVLLTAVHYLYAGVGALTLALRSGNGTAVLATAAAPPLIAAGFLFDVAGPLYCGAILLTAGVWSTAGSQLRVAARPGPGRVLLAVSSVAVVAPMVLAVLWALSVRWPGLPHLGIRLMVPFHGLVNAFGFVTCGLVAHVRARPPPSGRNGAMRRPLRLDLDLGGLRFGPFTAGDRARLLAEARAADLSYGPPVGHTLDLHRPMTGESIDVASFDGARAALRTWVAHRGVGFEVVPPEAPVEVGTTVLVVLRKGPFFVVARNRIVAVVDEPDRFGWAYGTLAGHPEWGEEAFLVERHGDAARVTIRTESGPASWAAKLAGPLVHQWQLQALRGYLRAIASAS